MSYRRRERINKYGTLYFGDNLPILKDMNSGSVDLIYLDPPFNSKATYNVLFGTGTKAESQIKSFDDTWHWSDATEKTYAELLKSTNEVAAVISGLRHAIKTNDVMAYTTNMTIRLIEMNRVLKDSGSLFLHCDPTVSHYLKVVLDAIFGTENFKNEIIWERNKGAPKRNQFKPRKFGRNHDVIFMYSKRIDRSKFHLPTISRTEEELLAEFPNVDDDGRRWKDDSSHIWRPRGLGKRPNLCYDWRGFSNKSEAGWQLSKERLEEEYKKGNIEIYKDKHGTRHIRRKLYLDNWKGKGIGNVWTDIPPPSKGERTGFQTQKPLALLERIIGAASDKGDVILDPFCGCGTAVDAAQKMGRNWIGIDVTHLAVSLIEERVYDKFGTKPHVYGIPHSVQDARELAARDKIQFEAWACSMIPGMLPNKKQAGDKGVDGSAFVKINNEIIRIVASVKGGTVTPAMVREVVGTVNSDNEFDMGVFLCLERPTRAMTEAASSAGLFNIGMIEYPKVQIYTVDDYFNDRSPKLPTPTEFTRQKD